MLERIPYVQNSPTHEDRPHQKSYAPQLGPIRAIKMITFEMGYTPGGFDRPITEHLKDEIQSKLCDAGVVTLTVIFQRGPRGERILYFDGPDNDIARAEAALNPNWETPIINCD